MLPLIITAMILAVQRLREMAHGGRKLAKWTLIWYVGTTLVAIVHSTLFVSLLWRRLFRQVGAESLMTDAASQALIDEREEVEIYQVVVDMFDSFIPSNIVQATASNALLSVLVTAIVVGYLVEGADSIIIRLVKEVERIITIIITFLITLAPIGVFFLILSNLMRLDLADVGYNLGVLIGATIGQILFHLFFVLPLLYFLVVRKNPYALWIRCSQAWITAWGTASSAGTLPITMKCATERGVPTTVSRFTVPLGCLINMDGWVKRVNLMLTRSTAIYFPIVVVFMAQTQGIMLNPAEYVIVVLLSTLASIGVTPIPSASLVLIVMICGSIGLPVTGMYAVVVAIDWLLDRFRTAANVSGDLYAAVVMTKITGIEDSIEEQMSPEQAAAHAQAMYEREMGR